MFQEVLQKHGERISQIKVFKLHSQPKYIDFRAPFGLGLEVFIFKMLKP